MRCYNNIPGIRALSLGAILLSGAAPLSVSAQEADTQEAEEMSGGLEAIVVTARRRTESLQTTPLAVSAFGAEAMEARNIQNSSELTNFVPNVQFDAAASESGGGATSQISIRGIGQTDYVVTVEPGVGVYLDGVYVGKSVGSLLDTVDVERIEVLRGPQGTLFGKNTIGGAIQLFSKRPTDVLEANAEITTGSYSRLDVKGAVSGPISDTVRVRVSGAYQSRDGHVKRLGPDGVPTGERQGNVNRLSGRLVVEADLTDQLMATMAFDGTRIREQTPGSILLRVTEDSGIPGIYNASVPGGVCLPSAGDARFSNPYCYNSQWTTDLDSRRTYASGQNQSDTDVLGASLRLDWDGDAIDLLSITAYRDVKVAIGQDLYSSSYFYGPIGQAIDWWQFSQEFQASGEAMDGRLNFVAGLYYSKEKATQEFPVNLVLVQFLSGGKVNNDSYAAFGQLTYKLTDQLSITAGARYTRDERRFNPGLQKLVGYDYDPEFKVPGLVNPIVDAFGPPGTPLFPAGWYQRNSESLTPMVTASYQATPDVMAYASFSQGFKGGGFTMRYFPPIIPDPGTDPDDIVSYAGPEKATAFEVGVKSELFDRHLRLNFAAFYTDYKDIQVTYVIDPDGPGPIGEFVPVLANAGDAHIKGFEVEATALLADWITLDGSVGYIDAKYANFSADALKNFPDAPGYRLANTPKWTLHLGGTVNFFDNDSGHLFARGDYSYRSSQFKEFSNTPDLFQKGYGILGASLTYVAPSKTWEVAVGGTNLTDEAYIVSGETSSEYSRAFVSRPREWYGRVKFNF